MCGNIDFYAFSKQDPEHDQEWFHFLQNNQQWTDKPRMYVRFRETLTKTIIIINNNICLQPHVCNDIKWYTHRDEIDAQRLDTRPKYWTTREQAQLGVLTLPLPFLDAFKVPTRATENHQFAAALPPPPPLIPIPIAHPQIHLPHIPPPQHFPNLELLAHAAIQQQQLQQNIYANIAQQALPPPHMVAPPHHYRAIPPLNLTVNAPDTVQNPSGVQPTESPNLETEATTSSQQTNRPTRGRGRPKKANSTTTTDSHKTTNNVALPPKKRKNNN